MQNFFLLRHFEVQKEFVGKFLGHKDVGLSDDGKTLATAFGAKLRADDMSFELVYSSDLRRCKETLSQAGFVQQATILPELREIDFKKIDGLSFDEIQSSFGIEFVSLTQWINELGCEPVESFAARVEKVFFGKIFQERAQNVLVCTHAGVIKTVMALVNGQNIDDGYSQILPYGACLHLIKNSDTIKVKEIIDTSV